MRRIINMKILLVEDDNDSSEIMSEFLEQLGHTVIKCTNGSEALSTLREEKIHVVLTDINMPEMDGLELLRQIKTKNELKGIAVVVYTGFREQEKANEAKKYGAYDYLLKPVNPGELAAIIKTIEQDYISLS